MHTLTIAGKTVDIFLSKEVGVPIIYLNPKSRITCTQNS